MSDVVVDFANDMKISIRWDGPPDDYMGTGYINDIEIPTSNVAELGDKTRRFEGYLDNLDLAGETLISGSANGRTGYINLFEIGVGVDLLLVALVKSEFDGLQPQSALMFMIFGFGSS